MLRETFDGSGLHPDLRWHCEPRRWALRPADGCLRVEPDAGTDFWQRTHYGIQADNGHFLFARQTGSFVLRAHVRFHPVHRYDQAGLMVRFSASCWLKASVEHEPGGPGRLGAVVTSGGYSDWSSQPFPPDAGNVWLSVSRAGADYLVHASRDGRAWEQIRVAHLAEDDEGAAACGLYACSPKAAGFVAEFTRLEIEPGPAR